MVDGQRSGGDAEAMNGVPKGSRRWFVVVSILLGCGIATGLYRESGIFSRLTGPVGVHLTYAFDTRVCAPPTSDVLLRTALWLILILCVAALYLRRCLQPPAAVVIIVVAIVGMWAQTYLWDKWADQMQAKLDEYKYVIQQDYIDWDRFYLALGQEAIRCPVTYEHGQWVIWIYPRIELREERVIKMMEQAGFEIRKCEWK